MLYGLKLGRVRITRKTIDRLTSCFMSSEFWQELTSLEVGGIEARLSEVGSELCMLVVVVFSAVLDESSSPSQHAQKAKTV